MIEDFLTPLKAESEKIVAKFRDSIASLRTSRPSPAMVEDILVEYYGSKMPLKHIAAISVVPPNMLVIQPWDKNALAPIEEAVRRSSLNISPAVDGEVVRIVLPPLTEERRKDLTKVLSAETEKAKIAFRMSRDEVRNRIQEEFNAGKLSDDDKFRINELLQKEVDKFNAVLKEVADKKEKEILSG